MKSAHRFPHLKLIAKPQRRGAHGLRVAGVEDGAGDGDDEAGAVGAGASANRLLG
jgi:hypothetical protein